MSQKSKSYRGPNRCRCDYCTSQDKRESLTKGPTKYELFQEYDYICQRDDYDKMSDMIVATDRYELNILGDPLMLYLFDLEQAA